MRACDDVCAVMLRATAAVQSFDLRAVATQPLSVTAPQLMAFDQSLRDLQAASDRMTWAGPHLLDSSTDLPQLLRCFARLTTALVAKLGALAAHPNPTSKTRPKALNTAGTLVCAFTGLWCLLTTACKAFGTWPHSWPALPAAEYNFMREALHAMMRFVLSTVRGAGFIWSAQRKTSSAQNVLFQAHTILMVPVSYLANLTSWRPVSVIIEELAALPPDFLSLLCDVTAEVHEKGVAGIVAGSVAAVNRLSWQEEAVAEGAVQADALTAASRAMAAAGGGAGLGVASPYALTGPGCSMYLLYLGQALNELMDVVLAAGVGEGGGRSCAHMFGTPSMVQLFERILSVCAQHRTANLGYDEAGTALRLALFKVANRTC